MNAEFMAALDIIEKDLKQQPIKTKGKKNSNTIL